MPWIKETSKDGRSNGRCRLNCGDFTIIEAKGKGKTFYYMDFLDGETRRTLSLRKLARRPIQDRADAFETARKARNRAYEESRSNADKREAIFSDFVPEYLNLIRNKRSYPTIKNVVKARLEPFFGGYKFLELDLSTSSKYVEERRSEGDADGTIILHLSIFRRMLNVASKFGYEVNAKKAISITDLELNSCRRERILESEEEEKLFSEADEFWKDLLTFALNTGLRLGNICHLKRTSVNFEARNITINGYESKNKKQFKIWMNPLVVKLLKRLKQNNGEHEYVFMRNGNGHAKPLEERWVQREFKSLTEKAGIHGLHFHDLRRTFGCRLVDMGVDLLSIKEAMAHKTIEATLCYVRPNEGRVKDAFNRIGQYWTKSGVKDGVKQ